ncbi:hypothetical protein ACROYT_G014604 [Oculina patagonica]
MVEVGIGTLAQARRTKEDRGCNPTTIGNHCASLLYPAKFLHREHAPDYQDIPLNSSEHNRRYTRKKVTC